MLIKSVEGEIRLKLLDSLVIDENLPKFKTDSIKEYDNKVVRVNDSVFISDNDGNFNAEGWGVIGTNPDTSWVEKKSIFNQFIGMFKGIISKISLKNNQPVYKLSIEEFFKSIKNTTSELINITGRAASYEKLLTQATEFGQVALAEKIKSNIDLIKVESQLYAMGLRTVISEENIVKFAQEAEKGVRLDYIKNFVRVIPPSVLDIKKKIDEKGLFDNYAIMHYDPDGKATKMTEEEIEKAKDPILFGLIKGSRKLYYVSDWIDDYCDLTLPKLIEVLGEEGVNEERLTVNIKVDTLC